MDLSTAADHVYSLFDVTEKRYDLSIAEMHINHACLALSEDIDVWFDQSVIDIVWTPPTTAPTDPRDYGSILVSGITNDLLRFGHALGVWKSPFGADYGLEEGSYREIIGEYGDTEAEEPELFAVHGDRIYFRPIPTVATTIRFSFQGRPIVITGGTNGWLTNSPYAVIYRAAELSAMYLLEDERVPAFRSMWTMEVERTSVDRSMIGHDAPTQAEEP